MLQANLSQLERVDPGLAARVARATPAPVTWAASRAGPLTASIGHEGRPLQLASRYDPLAEAKRLFQEYDPARDACLVVLGLGVGHHIEEAVRRVAGKGLLIVFEPDPGLIRAVFEQVDCTAWLGQPHVLLADGETSRGELIRRLEGFGGVITQGARLIAHPPTRQRRPEAVRQFSEMFTQLLAYFRTNVATALVNASRTIHNLVLNLPYYAAGANTDPLLGAASGLPAVCVGAGPSLVRNVDLLRDPAVRERVIVITAQTTLKPLLDRGVKPDFVTALDYHEISRRFYEGLGDLPDVTLVAEPKANPAILDAFPGPVRVTDNPYLRRLMDDQAPAMTPIRPGATVAHLSFYLAQHLGCDPIILIGQDLGFSDGLYYCPGTAIHDVWQPELGAFNTVEMMEWQRIVRHRHHLQKLDDVNGKPIYSDEQMTTYLKQFEREFDQAPQTVIDATEGGLPKQHTVRMSLAEAIERHAIQPVPPLPIPEGGLDPVRAQAAVDILRLRLDETRRLRQIARQTIPLLRDLIKHADRPDKLDKLHDRITRHREEAQALEPTFGLVNELNTIGAFRRARADRAIAAQDDDPMTRRQRQIERDIDNLDWMAQACDETINAFEAGLRRATELQPPLAGAAPPSDRSA